MYVYVMYAYVKANNWYFSCKMAAKFAILQSTCPCIYIYNLYASDGIILIANDNNDNGVITSTRGAVFNQVMALVSISISSDSARRALY